MARNANEYTSVTRHDRALLLTAGATTGFPSPADDYIERPLDLNEFLVRNPPATFFLRVAGGAMGGAGIGDGDILIVDRAERPYDGCIVVAVAGGELVLRRLIKRRDRMTLISEDATCVSSSAVSAEDVQIWGVVTAVIRRLEG